jgi:hypothetical protein
MQENQEKKVNVFPTKEQMEEANKVGTLISKEREKLMKDANVPQSEIEAYHQMEEATKRQLELREKTGQLKYEDEKYVDKEEKIYKAEYPTVSQDKEKLLSDKRLNNTQIEEISKPQMHEAFDVIKLPSLGKLYPNKQAKVKVAYLTAFDENILTSPNLLESGEFLEILINRKLLEPSLRYNDLLPQDRDAIMIWLRGTGYGEMYSVKILDEEGEYFDTKIDLSELPIKYLEEDTNKIFQPPTQYEMRIAKWITKDLLHKCLGDSNHGTMDTEHFLSNLVKELDKF